MVGFYNLKTVLSPLSRLFLSKVHSGKDGLGVSSINMLFDAHTQNCIPHSKMAMLLYTI